MQHISTDKRTELIDKLRSASVASVSVMFAGSGDSGSIEDIGFYDADNTKVECEATIDWPSCNTSFVDGAWKTEMVTNTVTLTDAVMDLCYEMLDQTGIDWYNNDGGFGELTIKVETGDIDLEVNTRYTEYNTYKFNKDCQEV